MAGALILGFAGETTFASISFPFYNGLGQLRKMESIPQFFLYCTITSWRWLGHSYLFLSTIFLEVFFQPLSSAFLPYLCLHMVSFLAALTNAFFDQNVVSISAGLLVAGVRTSEGLCSKRAERGEYGIHGRRTGCEGGGILGFIVKKIHKLME